MNSLGGIIEMTGIDRFMALELAAGTLQAEAGVTVSTRFITLGSAIAGRPDHAAAIAIRSCRRQVSAFMRPRMEEYRRICGRRAIANMNPWRNLAHKFHRRYVAGTHVGAATTCAGELALLLHGLLSSGPAFDRL